MCLALAVLTFAAYWPVRYCEFIQYDDQEYVTENAHVRAGLTWDGFLWAFRTNHAANWHPLTWLSHMLDGQLYGLNPAGHHMTNLLFHVSNTLLLFLVLQRMTGATRRSAIVAALFGLHPLHVESVAWVAERKDVLSALWFLLTLWTYTSYTRAKSTSDTKITGKGQAYQTDLKQRRGDATAQGLKNVHFSAIPRLPVNKSLSSLFLHASVFYVLALVLFTLGLMSKPMLVTLPFVLLLLDFWPLRRLDICNRESWIRHFVEKLPFFLLSIASSIVTIWAQRGGGAVVPTDIVPVFIRAGNVLTAYFRYLRKTVWPDDLAVFYPYPGTLLLWQVLGAAVILAASSIFVVRSIRRRPYLLTGWLWFLGMLVPVIGLLQVGGQSMADRYSYLPLIGLFIMVTWLAADLVTDCPRAKGLPWPTAVVVLLACFAGTRWQLRHWKDSVSLFQRAVSVTRGNYVMYSNLGMAVTNLEEKLGYFRKALHLAPGDVWAHINMGSTLLDLGATDEALAHLNQALQIDPRSAAAHNTLGQLLDSQGKPQEALVHYELAARLQPDNEGNQSNLGGALLEQGRVEAAAVHFNRALLINPDSAFAHNGLGAVLDAEGKRQEAILHYQKALRLNPNYADAHSNLGAALLAQGDIDGALTHLRQAILLNPNSASAHNNLGVALIRQGLKAEAEAHFEKSRQLKSQGPEQTR